VCCTPVALRRTHGSSMARRDTQRKRTVSRDQVIREYSQQASGNIALLAFGRVSRAASDDPVAWLYVFSAGYRGKPYVRSVRAQDPLAWSLGYIEATGWRGRV
jgi:hypothetical protein